jgi:hypothetical protein
LGEDIGAIAILLHHLLQPADLALDPAEALAVPLLDVGIYSAGLAKRRFITGQRAAAHDVPVVARVIS